MLVWPFLFLGTYDSAITGRQMVDDLIRVQTNLHGELVHSSTTCNPFESTTPFSHCDDLADWVCESTQSKDLRRAKDQKKAFYRSRCLPMLDHGAAADRIAAIKALEETLILDWSDVVRFSKSTSETMKRAIAREQGLSKEAKEVLMQRLDVTELKPAHQWIGADPSRLIRFLQVCGKDGMKISAFNTGDFPFVILLCPGLLLELADLPDPMVTVDMKQDATAVVPLALRSRDRKRSTDCTPTIDWSDFTYVLSHELGHSISGVARIDGGLQVAPAFDKLFECFIEDYYSGLARGEAKIGEAEKLSLSELGSDYWSRKTMALLTPSPAQFARWMQLACNEPEGRVIMNRTVGGDPELRRVLGCRSGAASNCKL